MEEIRQHTAELVALHEALLSITAQRNMAGLLQTIVQSSTTLLDISVSELFLAHPERQALEPAASYGAAGDYVDVIARLGERIAGHIARTGEPLTLENEDQWSQWLPEPSEERMGQMVGVPLKQDEAVIGVLCVFSAAPRTLSDEDVRLLSLFADQAVIVVRNVRLLETAREQRDLAETQATELRARERFLSYLNDLTQTALAASDASSLLDVLADRLGELIGADGCFLTLWDEETETAIPMAAYGPLNAVYPDVEVYPGEPTVTQSVLEAGHALAIEDVFDSPYASPRIAAKFPTRSMLGLPLIAGEQKLGAALIGFDEPHRFTEREIAQGEQAAAQIALALAKVRALQDARRRAEEAETLQQAGAVVASTLEQEEAVQRILEQLKRVVPYDSASVQLLHTDYLEVIGGGGWGDPLAVVGRRIPIPGENPNTVVIGERRSLTLRDAPASYALFREAPYDHIRSWLGVPLVVHDQVIGMLSVEHKAPDQFTDNDARLVVAFADQVAVAIENARLYAEMRELAVTDSLTGVYNRRGFFELGQREVERAKRFGRSLTAIMFDIDRFKRVNDAHGHAVGDQVLAQLAEVCQQTLREVDLIGRYGGEEFIVLLPETDLPGGYDVAERLRRRIEQLATATDAGPVKVTISLGVAELDTQQQNLEGLLENSDRALYDAKQAGRNCVRVWPEREGSSSENGKHR